ncbi:MAG TPA: hypothetical protein VGX02_07925, partial [Candidatus Eremiobacteraceae bacterium]|nr:hypothetical protein [Candidatus Eremiobacteraceae bacterium]
MMKGRDGGRPTRRRVLALLSAAGASILLGRGASSAASVQDKPWIIDTHHHIYPPDFTAQNIKRIMDDYPGSSASFYMNWSPRASLDQMDQNYVATA